MNTAISTNLAAIDIGSNAARILIKSVENTKDAQHIKKLQFLRIPLRLGMDVFGSGEIGEERRMVEVVEYVGGEVYLHLLIFV